MFQALILAATLAGTPVAPEYFCETVTVTTVWYQTWDALQDAYPGEYYKFGVRGFARIYKHNCTCTIHVLKPRKVLDSRTATVGHEFLHCLWGFYH